MLRFSGLLPLLLVQQFYNALRTVIASRLMPRRRVSALSIRRTRRCISGLRARRNVPPRPELPPTIKPMTNWMHRRRRAATIVAHNRLQLRRPDVAFAGHGCSDRQRHAAPGVDRQQGYRCHLNHPPRIWAVLMAAFAMRMRSPAPPWVVNRQHMPAFSWNARQ